MDKLQFIKEYKENHEKRITNADAKKDVEAFLNLIENNIVDVGSIKFKGVGTFSLLRRRARVISNPKTRERMTIYPLAIVKFTPTKAKKEK
ncbi:HU family DNA-binding protein [Fusobacterium varium]|uniref:HU family DNA-binding protein n=1 Tax=Fusobacterium varium TaxID=856 RepID=UPI000BBB5F07|nr:HU family DNA-binding protein [uncultured Fusobacterium sp.]BBA49778.1 putative DNA-binding protein [Fusobacterium varium]